MSPVFRDMHESPGLFRSREHDGITFNSEFRVPRECADIVGHSWLRRRQGDSKCAWLRLFPGQYLSPWPVVVQLVGKGSCNAPTESHLNRVALRDLDEVTSESDLPICQMCGPGLNH